MPNHCLNRVTIWSEDQATIENIKNIFEDESIFTHIIPEPDRPNMPLLTSDAHYGTKYGNDGELPQYVEDGSSRYVFKSTGINDQRWYDWRLLNWDTKWDAYDVVVTDDDPEQLEIEFNTAWSPPEAICHALREKYEDTVAISWFFDEPGCEIAGYL